MDIRWRQEDYPGCLPNELQMIQRLVLWWVWRRPGRHGCMLSVCLCVCWFSFYLSTSSPQERALKTSCAVLFFSKGSSGSFWIEMMMDNRLRELLWTLRTEEVDATIRSIPAIQVENTPGEITVEDASDPRSTSIVSVWMHWPCFLPPIPECRPAAELKSKKGGQ